MDAPLASDLLAPLRFGDRFVRELPGDPLTDTGPTRRRQVHHACWSAVSPTPVASPTLVASSREVADLLAIPPEVMTSPAFVEVLAGNRVPPGMRPWSACYGGHQFGSWAGQLGDGRAIALGELDGRDGQPWELQLKGAGPTPYSRAGDGRAVLRSSLREFLCSEAMHHLGVPTTRALSLVTTGDAVMRDMLYDGNPAHEPGAIVCRVAPSFLRFGNFEIFAHRDDPDTLVQLLDFTLRHHFPELCSGTPGPEAYAAWFREVCTRTAVMIAGWMRVGFVHGVMNTDNMSVLGLTIDYGPYGWIDDFDPDWTPNTTDAGQRRYRFGQQPQVAAWNLAQLARALVPVVPDVPSLAAGIDAYVATYERLQLEDSLAKLGLLEARGDDDDPRGDRALWQELLATLVATPTDMTIFFRELADVPADADDTTLVACMRPAWYDDTPPAAAQARMLAWLRRWLARVADQDLPAAERRARMNAVNPRFVLRNYMAQLAIDDATAGDWRTTSELLELLRRPYDEQPGHERWYARRPAWAMHKVGCSMLSCSS